MADNRYVSRGRFVSRSIATNEQLAGVSLLADFLFQRCIPHLDVEGRMPGNPLLIKAKAAPLRSEITPEIIPSLLQELATAVDLDGRPLVLWYEVNGVKVLEFPGFATQQKGLRKDREAPSKLPPPTTSATILAAPAGYVPAGPTPELVRSESGETPAEGECQGEVEVQSTTPPPPPAGANETGGDGRHVDRFTEPRHRDAYVGVRRAAQNPLGLDNELQLLAEGGERPSSGKQAPFGWAVVGEALHQLSVNGGRATSRALLTFCQGIANMPAEDEAARTKRMAQNGAKIAVMRGGEAKAPDAGEILAEVRKLIREQLIPGQGTTRVIRREDLELLGAAVVRAIDNIGGIQRVLATKPDGWGLLQHAFAVELARVRAAGDGGDDTAAVA